MTGECTVKKFYLYILALALLSGSAIYASAQTAYSVHPVASAFLDDHEHAWEEGRRQAQETGYQDGLNDGRSDFNTHHSFRPTQDGNYKHADRGYENYFGDKARYQEEYRQAYSRGYHEGYYNREHDEHQRGPDNRW
jgi:opacity protein-like surface antigen